MPDTQQKTFRRHIAYKVKISDILNNSFAKDDLSAAYFKLNGTDVSRINVIAAIVYKLEQGQGFTGVAIDDGTGRIHVRSFESSSAFSKIEIGEVVLIIGRVREFNNEKYIIPEIFKKIGDIGWVNVRKLELKMRMKVTPKTEDKVLIDEIPSLDGEVYSMIKNRDNGEGVFVDDIIKSFGSGKVEVVINKLLEKGDIFEIKPGKVRVLE